MKRKRGQNKYEKWYHYLNMQENVAIISDSFWYYICKFKVKKAKQKKRDEENKNKVVNTEESFDED